MITCPTDEVLKQVLADQVTAAEMETLVSHVEGCSHCQTKLACLTEEEGEQLGLNRHAPISTVEMDLLGGTASPGEEHKPAVEGFDILECLGRGGMGVVYQARDRKLKRLVALKMLPAGIGADPERVLRFRAEAAAAAGLHHPNIVPIYEIGECDGRPYFCSEYVNGGTLAQAPRGFTACGEPRRRDDRNARACYPLRARQRHRPPRPQAGQCAASEG